jgi:hypothetical protein
VTDYVYRALAGVMTEELVHVMDAGMAEVMT